MSLSDLKYRDVLTKDYILERNNNTGVMICKNKQSTVGLFNSYRDAIIVYDFIKTLPVIDKKDFEGYMYPDLYDVLDNSYLPNIKELRNERDNLAIIIFYDGRVLVAAPLVRRYERRY